MMKMVLWMAAAFVVSVVASVIWIGIDSRQHNRKLRKMMMEADRKRDAQTPDPEHPNRAGFLP